MKRARARRGRRPQVKARWHILVVDDEETMTESLAAWLREDGYSVDTASSGREAIEKARGARVRDLLRRPQDARRPRRHRDHDGDPQAAAGGLGHRHHRLRDRRHRDHRDEGGGAGVHRQALPPAGDLAPRRADHPGQEPASARTRSCAASSRASTASTTSSARTRGWSSIFDLVREVAAQRSTVLIQGESGTGKELVARAIHFSGDRGTRPVRRRLLRGARRDAARVGAVRPREGLLHRGGGAEEGQVRAGRRRHALPRRDRRHLAEAPGRPPARAAGAALLPGGRHRARSRSTCA